MTQYIFLATSLPPLQMESSPEISWEEFVTLIRENLLPGDYDQTVILRRYYDLLNMRSYWKGEELDPHGNWDENTLAERILDREKIPTYMNEYLDKYPLDSERIFHFSELIAAYFREELKHSSSFLKEYLNFERQLRLILLAYRAKKLNRDLLKELQFENPEEILIAQLLAQKDSAEFEVPALFEDLKPLLDVHASNPLELHKALCYYRFRKIDEMLGVEVFSFRRILGYMAQLIIVEKWLELDRNKGLEIVEKILKGSS